MDSDSFDFWGLFLVRIFTPQRSGIGSSIQAKAGKVGDEGPRKTHEGMDSEDAFLKGRERVKEMNQDIKGRSIGRNEAKK